jgi:integrase
VIGMNLSKLPSGKWRAIFYVDGERRSLTRPTKGEARRAASQAELDAGKQRNRETADATVAELVDARIAEARWSATLRADYLTVLERVPDAFLARRIRAVDVPTIKALYRQLSANGMSAHRVRRVHDLLSQSYKMAVEDQWVTVNPIASVRRPTIEASDIHPPAPADVARLVDAATPVLRLFLRLAASTGARRGELVALQWGDIRSDTSEVVIRRSLSYTPASGVVVGDTKTKSKGHRVVSVGLPTLAALRTHRIEQTERAVANGLPSPEWVFSHDAGVNPWRPDYATHAFAALRKSLDLDGVRLHDLRHFVATQMLAAGDSPVQVAGRLGHSTPTVTMSTYAHWIQSQDAASAERLERLISST